MPSCVRADDAWPGLLLHSVRNGVIHGVTDFTTPCQTESDKCANGRKRLFYAAFSPMQGAWDAPAPRLPTIPLRRCNGGNVRGSVPRPRAQDLRRAMPPPARHGEPIRPRPGDSSPVAALIHGARRCHRPDGGSTQKRVRHTVRRYDWQARSTCGSRWLRLGRGLAGPSGRGAGNRFGTGLASLAAACQHGESEQQDGGEGSPRDRAGHSASFRSTCGAGAASQALAGVPCPTVAGRPHIAGHRARTVKGANAQYHERRCRVRRATPGAADAAFSVRGAAKTSEHGC